MSFFVFNISLSTFNSWILKEHGFKFPIFLTWFQSLLLTLCSSLIRLNQKERMPANLQEIRALSILGFLSSMNIMLNNSSLAYISLGLNQIIRSSIALITFILSLAEEKKLPNMSEIIGLSLSFLGVVWSVTARNETQDSDSLGVALCLLSVVAGSMMLLTTSSILKIHMSPIDLAFRTAPFNLLFLSIPFYHFEFSQCWIHLSQHSREISLLLLLNGILTSVFLGLQNGLIKLVGPVVMTMLGQLKLVTLLLISELIFTKTTNGSSYITRFSWCTTVFGFWIYLWGNTLTSDSFAVFSYGRSTENAKAKHISIIKR